jgi:undecaprenyl diphosphate synthase
MDNSYYKDLVNKFKLKHIAIIMDGNRRWSKKEGKGFEQGYKSGSKSLKNFIINCNCYGIKYITAYTFSTANYERTQNDIDSFMNILIFELKNGISELIDMNINFKFIGDFTNIPIDIKKLFFEIEEKTKNNNGLYLQIAFNYSSREEIITAIKKITKKVINGNIKIEEINENLVSNELYTNKIPDPDLVIRTGGEKRISNFLLWQIAYSEILIFDKFWPDFNKEDLNVSIIEFSKRKRNFGK